VKAPKLDKKPWIETNQPRKWLAYQEGANLAAKGATGVGFQVAGQDDLVVFDLDHVVTSWDPTTRTATFTDLGARLIAASGSMYAEVSPSRTGLRLIGQRPAGLPVVAGNTAHKTADGEGLEVYGRGSSRYATVTGWALAGHEGQLGEVPHAFIHLLEQEGCRIKWEGAPAANHPSTPAPLSGAALAAAVGRASRALEAGTQAARLSYDEWLLVGQAVHAGLGEAGFDLWDGWSGADPRYKSTEDLRAKWRSFHADGGVTLGTLYHLVGVPDADQDGSDAPPGSSGKTIVVQQGQGATEESATRQCEAALVAARDPELSLLLQSDDLVRVRVMQPTWAKGRLLPNGDREPAPTIATLVEHDEASLRWAIARHVELQSVDARGNITVRGPKFQGLQAKHLLSNPLKAAPVVKGLLVHPLVLSDGRMVERPGFDDRSGLYVHLGGEAGQVPAGVLSPLEVSDHAGEALALAQDRLAFLFTLVADYEFDAPVDVNRSVAVAALATTLTRKDLDIAPAFLFVGPERGSGKTTLASICHVIATGQHLPTVTLVKDADMNKQMLFSALRGSPAAILIDNILADTELESGDLATILTSPLYEARLYHSQRLGAVPTNVAIFLTGNSVELDEDLASRTLPVRFSPSRPRRWAHPDWFTWALGAREEARQAVQYIQRAFIQHGGGAAGVGDQRFPAWAKRVRDPLLWAGAADVGQALLDSVDANPMRQEEGALLDMLQARFQGGAFTAGEVAKLVGAGVGYAEPGAEELRALLAELCPQSLGRSGPVHLGRLFKEKLSRWHAVEDGGRLRLHSAVLHGRSTWRVISEHCATDSAIPPAQRPTGRRKF
jgi:hypothetical protein